MKLYKILLLAFIALVYSSSLCFARGFIASEGNVKLLKEDLISEKLQVGKTRLYQIRKYYGDAPKISEDNKKIVYDYPDLKIEFSKKKILTHWEYDTFKIPVYIDEVDDLRKDLESEEIAGNNISYEFIVKNYCEPTDLVETEGDGMQSIYYYGDIKLVFENYITLKKFKIKGLDEQEENKNIFVAGPREIVEETAE